MSAATIIAALSLWILAQLAVIYTLFGRCRTLEKELKEERSTICIVRPQDALVQSLRDEIKDLKRSS